MDFFFQTRRANSGANLSGLDSELVSMVILEQVTLVIRSLRTPCLLPDSILTGNIDTISQTQIRYQTVKQVQANATYVILTLQGNSTCMELHYMVVLVTCSYTVMLLACNYRMMLFTCNYTTGWCYIHVVTGLCLFHVITVWCLLHVITGWCLMHVTTG